MALNTRQLKFVAMYQRTLAAGAPNATQAYIDAGYKCSRASAEAAAARLLASVAVQQLLQPVKQAAEVARVEQVRTIEVTRDRIRLEMARLAFANPKNLFHPDGTAKGVHELDDDTAAALAGFEVEEERVPGSDAVVRTRKFKFWDKNKALSNLADTEPGVWAEDAKGRPATPVTINLTRLSDDDLDRLERMLDQSAGAVAVLPADPGAGPG